MSRPLFSPFLSWPLASVCCSFCAFFTHCDRNDARQNENENSQLVLNTTTGLPLSSTFFIFLLSHSVFTIPPLVNSKCRISVVGQETQMWNTAPSSSISACSSFPHILSFDFLSAWTGGWMEGKGVSGCWVSPHQTHPCKLVEGDRMVEGLWWCGWWNSGGGCAGLVPTTASSGRVGIWILEVDSPMSRCMCRVLGVCFWHLLCYIKETKWNIWTYKPSITIIKINNRL